ncbi:MAG TPA: ABC transporter substrate-binding protein, partial [Coleofasciculaceae cyanobacterium]
MHRLIALAGLLTATVVGLSACSSGPSGPTTSAPPAPQAQSGTVGSIPIGVGVAQSSNVALLGQEQVAGARLAEKYFNDQGGVNGTPIKLVFQDTAGDEQGAVNAFQTLITKDKVVGIVGPTLS